MNPEIWGSHGWKFLHAITIAYPDEPTELEKNQYKTFFQLIEKVLPCYECGKHFSKLIEKYPLTEEILSSRKNIIQWLINLHNDVNIRLNKKEFNGDINTIYKENNSETRSVAISGMIIFLFIIISIMVYLSSN